MGIFFHPLEPIAFEDSNTLILGSFPSLKSFEEEFYYAHPKNQFWRLLSKIYGAKAETKEERIELLKSAKIALWDVAASCERTNSSDANLKNILPNNIEELFVKYPNIKRILFTGRTAEKLYFKYFLHIDLPTTLLPSPSPAYAAMDFASKLFAWQKILLGFSFNR